MKKVLIAYYSLSGHTESMAQYVAEGVRMGGQQATVKKVTDLKTTEDIAGYDGYIFGCPTYYLDMTEPMKQFLFRAKAAGLEGKLGGAFGSHTHDGSAPVMVFDTMQKVFKMEPFELGPLNLKEDMLGGPAGRGGDSGGQFIAGEVHTGGEGNRACQDYGRVFGEKLGD